MRGGVIGWEGEMKTVLIVALALGLAVAGCGKKGDPTRPGAVKQEKKE